MPKKTYILDTNVLIYDPSSLYQFGKSTVGIPVTVLEELEKLDKSKKYYVYCRSGKRSSQACDIMNSIGFENTYNLEGGFMNWEGEVAEQIINDW